MQRIVLLGASNLTNSFRRIWLHSQQLYRSPLQVLAALGHGRSYGATTRVLGRTLPGIVPCELWSTWDQLPPLPTVALLTDLGNDFFYNFSATELLDWVETCVQRCAGRCESIIVTKVPLERAMRVANWQFRIMRGVMFPGCQASLTEIQDHARDLNQHLEQLTARYPIKLIEQPAQWYGWDPIHHAWLQRRHVWSKILSGWSLEEEKIKKSKKFFSAPKDHISTWSWWHKAWPVQQNFWGREQQRVQPCLQFSSGSSLHLF